MRLFFVAAFAAAFGLLSRAERAAAVDELFPAFGDARIDVEHYDLDLDVALPANTIDAKATLRIRALRALDAFTLDLAALVVSSVRLDGAAAEFEQKNDKLVVRPKRPIRKNAAFKLVVTYAGAPKALDDPTEKDPGYALGWRRAGDGVYVIGQPTGASTFFPSNEVPDDKATFRIAITAPAGYTAASNGLLKSAVDRPRGKRRTVWAMAYPMQPVLATVHINKYRLRQAATADGKPLRYYTTLKTSKEDEAAYAKSRAMMTFFEAKIGRYPFDNYGTVTVDDPRYAIALETQSLSSFPRGDAGEGVIAHELAHQWLGDAVSVKRWKDIWISEGGATYFEVLWKNRESGAAFDEAMGRLYRYAVREKLGPSVIERPEQLFADRVYARGALSYYALRQRVGDATFLKIMRAFIDRYRYLNATSQDFVDVALEVSGDAEVVPILNAWLYDRDVPRLAGVPPAAVALAGEEETPDIVGLQCGKHRRPSERCGGRGAAGSP